MNRVKEGIEDYKNAETPFVQEIIDTGIKVA